MTARRVLITASALGFVVAWGALLFGGWLARLP